MIGPVSDKNVKDKLFSSDIEDRTIKLSRCVLKKFCKRNLVVKTSLKVSFLPVFIFDRISKAFCASWVLLSSVSFFDVSALKENMKQQDKVKYAVSEREDRVTDLTTLTRMTSCTGMYWAANGLQMGCTELWWGVLGFTELK